MQRNLQEQLEMVKIENASLLVSTHHPSRTHTHTHAHTHTHTHIHTSIQIHVVHRVVLYRQCVYIPWSVCSAYVFLCCVVLCVLLSCVVLCVCCVVLCCVCLQRRVDSGTSLNRLGRKIRTSWQETDIDRAISEAERTSSDVRILVETWKVCVCVCVCVACVWLCGG